MGTESLLLQALKHVALSYDEPVADGETLVLRNVEVDPKKVSRYLRCERMVTVDKCTIAEMVVSFPQHPSTKHPFVITVPAMDIGLSVGVCEPCECLSELASDSILPMISLSVDTVNVRLSVGELVLAAEMHGTHFSFEDAAAHMQAESVSVSVEHSGTKGVVVERAPLSLDVTFTKDRSGRVVGTEQAWRCEEMEVRCNTETYTLLAQSIRQIFATVYSSKGAGSTEDLAKISVSIGRLRVTLKDLVDGEVGISVDDIRLEVGKLQYTEAVGMFVGTTVFQASKVSVGYECGDKKTDVLWTVKDCDAIRLSLTKKVEKAGVAPVGQPGTYVDLKCQGIGCTLDLVVLSRLVELLKVTVKEKISTLSVDQAKIEELKEKTEQRRTRITSKYERFLQYMQIKSIVELMGKVKFAFELCDGLFTVKFQSSSVFTVEVGRLTLNNLEKESPVDVLELCNKKMKRHYSAPAIEKASTMDVEVKFESVRAYGEYEQKRDNVFFADSLGVVVHMVFDASAPRRVPAAIYLYGRSDDMEITVSHAMFMDIYGYIEGVIKGFQEKERERLKEIGRQIGTTVSANATKITDSAVDFVNKDLKNIRFPTIAVLLSFGKGKVELPIASMVYRSQEHDTSRTTEIIRSELDLLFVSNETGKSLGVIIDEIVTGSVESILDPLVSVSKKPKREGFLFDHLPQSTPSLVLTLDHVSSKVKEFKNVSMNVQLYGVQVRLHKLGIFGRDDAVPEDKGTDQQKETATPVDREASEAVAAQREASEEELGVRLKVIDFFREKYRGFEVNVQMSECDVVAEDQLHTITITTSNKYIQHGEEICKDLNRKIELEKAQQDGLEMEIAQLKVKLASLREQQDLKQDGRRSGSQTSKLSRLAFWKK